MNIAERLATPVYERTLALAKRLHEGQTDKGGKPYWEHLERVARIVLERWPEASDAAVQAALLHDAPEDTAATAETLRASGVPAQAIAIVQMLSRDDGTYFERGLTYLEWVGRIAAAGNADAIRVKLADNLDNSDPARAHPGREKAMAARYLPARVALEEGLRRLGG